LTFLFITPPPPPSTLFPYTTLFRSFAHEAGIHQDGMLKNRLTYEIMTPQSVGVPDSKLVLGKHSGRHALSLRCDQLGYHFERREDRKSTRLNSSHVAISYAVFCLKK